jgi:hypothetical protein
MQRLHRSTVRAALAALVATGVVVVATPESATALPAVCSSGASNVHNWTAGGATDNWDDAANWTNGVPNGATQVACIANAFAFQNSTGILSVTVAELHLQNATLDIDPNAIILVNGPAVSVWDVDTQVFVDHGRFGGTGRIDMHGLLDFSANSQLASINAPGGTSYGGPVGVMQVATDGELSVSDSGLALFTGYRIENHGRMTLDSDSFVSADYGTATVIEIEGTLTINGDGGYYQGFPVSGQPLSFLGSHGLLEKASGSGTSVVDAWYVQGAAGRIEVNCCGTLALPDATIVGASVVPNMTFATGACGPQTITVCQGSVNPAVDPMSVELHIPAANPQTAGVILQELTQPPPTTDSRAIGNEVFAHADQLAVDPANPATIELRFSQADVMATPLPEIQVGHISDAGVMTKTPDCISGTLPPGAPYCVDRALMSRTIDNTFVVIKTTQTSRWRVRRNAPGESFDQTAPGAPQGFAAKLAAPFDGSGVTLSWSAPANDGGAAPTAYRVFRDGALLTTTNGPTALLVQSSGPGAHVFRVSAVNVIGEGLGASAAVTLDPLSKPRKVKALRGAAGGKKTAGARWKAPADSGGFAITGYKLAVFKANGKKVDTQVVKATRLKFLFKLKPGRYFFKVRARNSDRWGPWSKPTDLVRPR